MNKMFNLCPACGSTLIITECKCVSCNLLMRGDFSPARSSALSDEHLAFIQVFLRARGNLTETERVLGVSYPTIRNKIDEINAVLERFIEPPGSADNRKTSTAGAPPEEVLRRAILQQVADGSLPPAEADLKLQNLSGEQL